MNTPPFSPGRNTERIFDHRNVMPAPRQIIPVSASAGTAAAITPVPAKNIELKTISIGKRPLHGIKLLVSIAIIRSLPVSIIRHPVTPAALQPSPMHIVSACFPQAPHFSNGRSILQAARGRYPRSSSNVNSGKKIAIGGSITDTT